MMNRFVPTIFFVRHFNECLLITLDNLKYYQPFKNTIRIQLI